MIPKLSEASPFQAKYLSFIERLNASGFSGDIHPDFTNAATLSIDDPLYQTLPQAIISPKSEQDIRSLVELSALEEFQDIAFLSNRAKNGLLITDGLIIDLSKHMADSKLDASLKLNVHSSKRTLLMSEWLRRINQQKFDLKKASKAIKRSHYLISFFPKLKNTISKRRGDYDFSNEVYESMMSYSPCEFCIDQGSSNIEIEAFKTNFLELYHSRYLRPFKDYLIGFLEFISPVVSIFPKPYNWIMGSRWVNHISSKYLGLSNTTQLSKLNLKKEMVRRGIRLATPLSIESLSPKDRLRAVIVIQDVYTSYFETELVLDTMEMLSRLGFQAYLAPYTPNGKPLYKLGFMKSFNRAARKNLDMIQNLSFYGLPFIGIDPSMTLTYRSEYAKNFSTSRQIPTVHFMQDWLAGKKEHLIKQPLVCEKSTYYLMAHESEKTDSITSTQNWQEIYRILGLELHIEKVNCFSTIDTNEGKSSWEEAIVKQELHDKLVATGYFSRKQAKQLNNVDIPHPAQILLKHLRDIPII
ncbi:MAG: hypothetical protein ACSHXJ_15285 [Marinomonas colpomeniae]